MTADQLNELALLCAKSMRSGDAFIDQLADSLPRSAVAAVGAKRYLVVERKGSDPETGPDPLTGVANLLAHSCLGPEVRKLRKHQERHKAASEQERVPQEVWVVGCEAYTEAGEPNVDVQALACLRILKRTPQMRKYGWLVRLAGERLHQLMVKYPALTHPRILWAAERQAKNAALEPLPLAHAMARLPYVGLPTPSACDTQRAFRHFASHPIVAAGIACRAPVTTALPPRSREAQGLTLGQVLGNHPRGRARFMDTLLRIERVRAETGVDGTLLGGSAANALGLRECIGRSFATTWTTSRTQATPLHASLLAELTQSPFARSQASRAHLLSEAIAIFSDPSGAAQTKNGVSLVVTDQRERYQRLTAGLAAIGAYESEALAGRAVLQHLFPEKGEGRELNPMTDVASVDAAHFCIEHWLDSGTLFPEIERRLIATKSPDSPWFRAATAIGTRLTMADAIQKATKGQAGGEAVPRARRSMGV